MPRITLIDGHLAQELGSIDARALDRHRSAPSTPYRRLYDGLVPWDLGTVALAALGAYAGQKASGATGAAVGAAVAVGLVVAAGRVYLATADCPLGLRREG